MRFIEHTPFAPAFMESSRAIGYSLEAAVSDIIDNSITAHASNVDIKYLPQGNDGPFFYILDDGDGMSETELHEAMRYGSQSPTIERDADDLGRYGLGLKTASLSQCRMLTVISKIGNKICGRRWDLDIVLHEGKWALLVLEDSDMKDVPGYKKLLEKEHGTLVVWQHLDKMFIGDTNISIALGKKMDVLTEHLSLVFHRYLTGETGIKKLSIALNNREISPIDPFLVKKSLQIMDDEIIHINNSEIRVKPYILPHLSKLNTYEINQLGGKEGLRKGQGFYVYRNKRLIVWGTWFRLMRQGDLSKLARVQVDIPNSLDDLWTLDIKKSTAIPPEIVRMNLLTIIKKISDGSKRTWTYRGKKETGHPEIQIWNRIISRDKSIYYIINEEHPLIKEFINQHPDEKNQLKSIITQIQWGIPLNQLYLDLNNDEKIENETATNYEELISSLVDYLESISSKSKRNEIVQSIISSQPFVEFKSNLLKDLNSRGLI